MPASLKMHCPMTSGLDSPNSGRSSNTTKALTSSSQDETEGGELNPTAPPQDILGPQDRPLPIRKRQRKPCRKGKTIQREAPPSPSCIHKAKGGCKKKQGCRFRVNGRSLHCLCFGVFSAVCGVCSVAA